MYKENIETFTDHTFFTNEPGATLLDRFKQVLKDTKFFDVLVGYFRFSGFNEIYASLENVSKIRILVGINIDEESYKLYQTASTSSKAKISEYEAKNRFSSNLARYMENSADTRDVEIGIRKFIDLLQNKVLELKVYPSENIHAKVYICRYKETDRDYGSVITGSSNFSQSGLIAQREFNVQLKQTIDVQFALEKFNDLWEDGVDISSDFVETINKRTWLNNQISPYEIYLKLIYEYFEEDINIEDDLDFFFPPNFLELRYQKQAVLSAKKILESYNGVFISDVVGLGKTYIASLLAQQLTGGILVICPPVLKGYWENSLFEFGVRGCKVESLGKLESIKEKGTQKFNYIFIDEAHRFRNEYTYSFELLHQICWGKKVILVSATPLNNSINDIFSQLKLFQSPKNSTLPGVANLEVFFAKLNQKFKNLKKTDPEYADMLKDASQEIREKLLKYIMIRRTRSDVVNYFKDDLQAQNFSFPEVAAPKRIVYIFSPKISDAFQKTVSLLKKFNYSRYTPLLYLKKSLSEFEKQSQRNIGGFMKTLLIKRLESSFLAFKKSIARFIASYKKFISMYNDGRIYISKKVSVFDMLENDQEELLLKLVEEQEAQLHNSSEFSPELLQALQKDLSLLDEIQRLWKNIEEDPKIDEFKNYLTGQSSAPESQLMKGQKLIVFTESKETGEFIFSELEAILPGRILFYSSKEGITKEGRYDHSTAREIISANFDPTSQIQKNDIQILITTDILAEGMNLHKANMIVNYDLPWNPTRVMQRAGRINRIGTKHNKIYFFNFFPADQVEAEINLESNIISKIQSFHDTLGEDAKYLSENEEPGSQEMFGETIYKKLNSRKSYTGEDEPENSELEYLELIRNIRDEQPDLFKKIKDLPKKSRSAHLIKGKNIQQSMLLTFFRLGKLKKFYLSNQEATRELDFLEAINYLKCDKNTERQKIGKDYFDMLDKNKRAFEEAITFESNDYVSVGSQSNIDWVLRRLCSKDIRQYKSFTESDEAFLKNCLNLFEQGILPKKTAQTLKKAMEKPENNDPLKVLQLLQKNIGYNFKQGFEIVDGNHTVANIIHTKREVILSSYLAPSTLFSN